MSFRHVRLLDSIKEHIYCYILKFNNFFFFLCSLYCRALLAIHTPWFIEGLSPYKIIYFKDYKLFFAL